MGLGRKPFHLVDFHDVPDGMFQLLESTQLYPHK